MNKASTVNTFSNLYMLFLQTRRVLFTGKFYYVFGFILLWELIFIIIAHVDASSILSLEEIFILLILIPMLVMTLFVSMMLVMFEKDNITIETIFSIPGSPYKVWLYKISVQFIVLSLIEIMLAVLAFVFIADFPVHVMVFHAFMPVFFIANLNFFLSTLFKNGYAGGLATLFVLFICFIIAGNSGDWVGNLFISPFNRPYNLDIILWNKKLLYNKSVVSGLGIMWMYFGLRLLRNREPFIK